MFRSGWLSDLGRIFLMSPCAAGLCPATNSGHVEGGVDLSFELRFELAKFLGREVVDDGVLYVVLSVGRPVSNY